MVKSPYPVDSKKKLSYDLSKVMEMIAFCGVLLSHAAVLLLLLELTVIVVAGAVVATALWAILRVIWWICDHTWT